MKASNYSLPAGNLLASEERNAGHFEGTALAGLSPRLPHIHNTTRPRIRWGWISAIALGCLIGLLVAALFGVTGARLGAPDDFDLDGVSSGSP
jgi:hypothetical protein